MYNQILYVHEEKQKHGICGTWMDPEMTFKVKKADAERQKLDVCSQIEKGF